MTNSTQRILVMEEDANHRYIIQRILSHVGYAVELAKNLAEAEQQLNKETYHLFICSINVRSDEADIKRLHELCARLIAGNMPVVITAYESHHRPIFDQIGVDHFIRKPLRVHPLLETVNGLLGEGASL